jgi:excisionase family DNA binding protein
MTQDDTNSKLTMSVEETGRALGISRATAYALANQGSIPSIRLGHRLLIPKAALEKMLQDCQQKAADK